MNAPTSDILLDTLIARTIGKESFLSMGALLAAPIPPGVARYMHTGIVNRLAEDLTLAPHFARLASPAAGPDAVRDALLTHAAGQYVFPRDEFLELLENATRFTENYLCRPRWTLSSFLFLDQPAITTEMLLHKLDFIADYAYLPQLLRRMVTSSGRQVVTPAECSAAIARIDDAVIREHTPRERGLLARPIFRFFLLTSDIENKPIALRALLLFLEDKRLGPLCEYVEGVWHMRGKSDITIEEFIELNEDFAAGQSSPTLTPAMEEPPKQLPGESAEPATAVPEMAVPAIAVPENALPDIAVIDVSPPPEIPPWEPPPRDAAAQEAPIKEFGSFEEDLTPPTIPSLREELLKPPEAELPGTGPPPRLAEMIPDPLRRRFVHVICGRDAEFYELVIARLDEMHSWAETSAYLRELFDINDIDPFEKTAIAFTDVLQKRCNLFRTAQQ